MRKSLALFSLILLIVSCKQQRKKVDLEKIVFHTSECFGKCPTYHLQVDKDQRVKLYAEQVFKKPGNIASFEDDTARMGYFTGKASDSSFRKLTGELNKIELDTLEFDKTVCCDGSLITIIVYYNGKRKYLKSMFPPAKADKLISVLYEICHTSALQRTNDKLRIENN